MTRRIKKRLALLCVALLISATVCGLASGFVGADQSSVTKSYVEIPLYVDGILIGNGFKIGPTTYVPIRAFSEVMGRDVQVSWDAATQIASVTMDGLSITAQIGTNYLEANGRCFYLLEKIFKVNGSVVVPIREISKAFGVPVMWHEDWSISLEASQLDPIESGSSVYNEEDLYWLSRIINAESGNQPLDGKIGVGNVVMNRVVDPTCPDSIIDVIFDNEYGVQFSVTENGAIYLEPNEESVIAAKICLEGYNTVGASIFFVNPEIGISEWFRNTRTYIVTIGEHDFYA